MEKVGENRKISCAECDEMKVSKIKICVICPEIGNSGGNAFIGGHVNNVVQLTKALSDRGHEITIITTPHRYPGDELNNGLEWAEIYCLPMSGSYLSAKYGIEFALRALQKVRKLHTIKNFDIIHGHSGYSMLGLITGIGGRITRIPSIHSIYSPIQPIISHNTVMFFSNKILSKFYLSQVNKIIAVSKNVRDSLISAGLPQYKIEMMPPGIDTNMYNPSISGDNVRKYFGIGSDIPLLLYVGNLTKIKGIHIFIEALKIIVKQFPDIKLLMALNMPLSKYEEEDSAGLYDTERDFEIKEKIKSYGLNDNVIPLGIVKNMPQVMAASDVFITPFLNTVGVVDYPTSLLEAMAVGKPVIATRVGGIPEIVKHKENGLLVEPGDVHELKNALLYILENKDEAKRMGENAAKYVAENYSVGAIVEKIERVYEGVISNYSGDRRH